MNQNILDVAFFTGRDIHTIRADDCFEWGDIMLQIVSWNKLHEDVIATAIVSL